MATLREITESQIALNFRMAKSNSREEFAAIADEQKRIIAAAVALLNKEVA
jgi:hypothetical protein